MVTAEETAVAVIKPDGVGIFDREVRKLLLENGRGGWAGGACDQLDGARQRCVQAFGREEHVVGRAQVVGEIVGERHQVFLQGGKGDEGGSAGGASKPSLRPEQVRNTSPQAVSEQETQPGELERGGRHGTRQFCTEQTASSATHSAHSAPSVLPNELS
eukprot:scaffold4078_cov68-Phaeocystis_antarctica.AAC.5